MDVEVMEFGGSKMRWLREMLRAKVGVERWGLGSECWVGL